MRSIFATGNEGKMREIRMIMADLGLEILSMKEAGLFADVDENGKTFEFKELFVIIKNAGQLGSKGESLIQFEKATPGYFSSTAMLRMPSVKINSGSGFGIGRIEIIKNVPFAYHITWGGGSTDNFQTKARLDDSTLGSITKIRGTTQNNDRYGFTVGSTFIFYGR